jgi:phospholipid-binding lipoprotein MlaA
LVAADADEVPLTEPVRVPADDPIRRFVAVDDPIEPFNRGIYAFNAVFDEWVFVPALGAYTTVVPEVLRDRIGDFFANVRNLTTFANLVLQARPGAAAETALRFGVNTMLGLFGFVDLASAMGLPKYEEDFGQTLGVWGVDAGPYLVLPVLGPSNARDASGLAVDRGAFAAVDPFGYASLQSAHPEIVVLEAMDTRLKVPFRYFETGSPFEYEYVRLLYTRKRQLDIDN